MASAVAPSSRPVASLPARRSFMAPRAVAAAGPHPPLLSRRLRLSTGGARRSRLRVVASSSKADPVEEKPPVAPLADVPVPADASPPGPPGQVEPEPQPQHMAMEGLQHSLPARWDVRPCTGSDSWIWGKQVWVIHPCFSSLSPNLQVAAAFLKRKCSFAVGAFLAIGLLSDHWRKNIPVLAMAHRVYAIDLIGYGYSDKPNPREIGENFYTFETWGEQLNTFCAEVAKSEAFFICNSIGGLVGLQAAVMEPQKCKGIVLLDISLRMLHIKKQPWFGKPFIKSFQSLLRNTIVGKLFFNAVATPESVKNILCQCYYDTSAVTDELVQIILQPGLDPGAVDVFLEFICYSGGPLPEELLPLVKCPVLVAWGEKDPWEPVELGRAYASFDTVEDFVVLPDVGHCPQDEAPELVNPLVESFVQRHR